MSSTLSPASTSIAADAVAAATELSTFDHLDDSVLTEIISYVGKNEYCFVAGINRRFKQAYLVTFPNKKMKLQNPLRADQQSFKVFFIDKNGFETEIEEVEDEEYINQLKRDVRTSGILNVASEENPRPTINEDALVILIRNASKQQCPAGRAKRAAQVANTIQPDFSPFMQAGEKFLQQLVYSPIAELFCAFSNHYRADKNIMCAHGVFCREYDTNVQCSVACLPDAALQLTHNFYLIAMMELKCIDSGNPYKQDFFRCKLMTAMSLLAIVDYLVNRCRQKQNQDDLDIAIPFLQGSFDRVDLYVMRMQGRGCPKIHWISTGKFSDQDSTPESEKLNLLSQLAVLLARVVEITINHCLNMDWYFRHNYDFSSAAIPRNAISDDFEDDDDDEFDDDGDVFDNVFDNDDGKDGAVSKHHRLR